MKIYCTKHMLLLALTAFLFAGCVISQVSERQGTRAFLQKDYETAVVKYTEAAEQGNANAQYHLGYMYTEGLGVKKDLGRAAELLALASAQGQADAQLMLGLFYVYGDGVPMDPAKGAKLIEQSATDGNDVAMYYMGNLYAAGLGVPKDTGKALDWFQQAKDAGFPLKEGLCTREGVEKLYKD